MASRNAVQIGFDQFGKRAGLEKKSGWWYRRGTDVIAASNLQKSQYGPKYYFNQHFTLRVLTSDRHPRGEDMQIQCRLEVLLPAFKNEIEELLDRGTAIADDQRLTDLTALLTQHLIPLLERADTLDGLRAMDAEGAFKGTLVKREIRPHLGRTPNSTQRSACERRPS